jgi:type I restriction enzyme S subunit
MAYSGFIQSLYRGIRERSSDFNYQVFGNQFLYIPPIEEQQEIVEYIDAATTKADKMIVELTNHVESMKEYKQRLIADVVTGKINVQP